MIGIYVHKSGNSERDYVLLISENADSSVHELPVEDVSNVLSECICAPPKLREGSAVDDEMHRIASEIMGQHSILSTSSQMQNDPQFVHLYSQVLKVMCRITSNFADMMIGRGGIAGINPALSGSYVEEVSGIAAMAPVFAQSRNEVILTIEDVPNVVWRAFAICQPHACEIVRITENSQNLL